MRYFRYFKCAYAVEIGKEIDNKKCQKAHMPPFPDPWLTLLGMINVFNIDIHYVLDLWLQNQNGSSTCHDQLHVKFEDCDI